MKPVNEFYQYPLITKINRVYEKEPEFPMVTICDADYYYSSYNKKKCENKYEIIGDKRCHLSNRGKNATFHKVPKIK